MASETLGILCLIRVRAEDRLVANEPRFQKEQAGTGKERRKRKKKTRRKMREEEKGREEEATENRGRGSLSCTNSLSGGLE